MKTNYHNNIVICFDLHDTLLSSQSAWIDAFKIVTNENKELFEKIKEEYLLGGWKREICKKYGFEYDSVKNEYLKIVKPMNDVKKFCEHMQKNNRVFVITNATLKRAKEDIDILNMNFEKIYSRDDGIKPNKDYIEKIMKDNNIEYLIMVGNEKERDIFDLKNTWSIIVDKDTLYSDLIKKYNEIVNQINNYKQENK